MLNLGDFPASATVEFKWSTQGADGASITRATDGTLKIYKGHSATERSSLNGVTQTEDFDSATGIHHVQIDLSDNTDAGFYAAGNEYQVVMTGMTIDGKSVNAVIAHFSIERSGGILALLKSGTFGLSQLDSELDTIAGYIDTEVAAIKAKTDNLPSDPADASDIATAFAAVPAAVWDELVEPTGTPDRSARILMRLFAAVLLGKVSGMDTNSPVFRDVNDTKDRVSATSDTDGNRTAVTLDGS